MNQTISPTPLLDLLSSPNPRQAGVPGDDNELAARAEQLIDFALAEHKRIAELDLGMGRLSLRFMDPQGANAMRGLYQQWAARADELLEGVRRYGLRERLGAKYEELERATGRTWAMLSITLQSLSEADEQFKKGETFSLEEVRRELRAAAGR
jgi:hypothetical protein